MDFDLRQWLLILGPVFIVGVLLHGAQVDDDDLELAQVDAARILEHAVVRHRILAVGARHLRFWT